MTCFEGINFNGNVLFTKDCAEVGKAWHWAGADPNPSRTRPGREQTAMQRGTRRAPKPVVNARQLPAFDAWLQGVSLSSTVTASTPTTAMGGVPKSPTPAGAIYVSRGTQTDSNGEICSCGQQSMEHVVEKEKRDCKDVADSEEDLMTSESPEHPHFKVGQDWW